MGCFTGWRSQAQHYSGSPFITLNSLPGFRLILSLLQMTCSTCPSQVRMHQPTIRGTWPVSRPTVPTCASTRTYLVTPAPVHTVCACPGTKFHARRIVLTICTFSCGDVQYIPQIWKCDGTADCSNLVDEENCPVVDQVRCDHTTQSTCDEGACILSSWWSDGDADCPDRSDENEDCPDIVCGEV